MSDPARIFVSHSSLDTQLTRDVCDLLAPGPDGAGYDVLVDYTELKPGVDWPRHLHEYMAHCHAAILLLTPNAVASPWVLKEATILAWRRSLDPSFKLFPVRLPGVDDSLLEKAKFAPLMLGLIQQIATGDAQAVADAVRAQLGEPEVTKPTPFDRLVGRLRDLLAKVGPDTLKDIAERMSVQPPAWRPDLDVRAQYVTQIARRILSEDLGGFKGVDQLVDALSFTPAPENVKQIFRIVAPYWVDAEAAARLPPLWGVEERRAAALNGAFSPAELAEFTALAYVRRAHPLSLQQKVIHVPGGGNSLAYVEQQICKWMRDREGAQGSNEDIVAELGTSEQTYYAVLPEPVDDEALTDIVERFPALTFILWTGEQLEPDETLTRVEWIEPQLQLERQKRAYQSYRNAINILRTMESSSL